MDTKELKELRLHAVIINPALNDGNNGNLRIEANQWITDGNGNVTDVKHRLEANDTDEAFIELAKRAKIILPTSFCSIL